MSSNLWLFIMVQSVAACVIGWLLIAIALYAGQVNAPAILTCIGVGFVAGFPIAGDVVNRMTRNG